MGYLDREELAGFGLEEGDLTEKEAAELMSRQDDVSKVYARLNIVRFGIIFFVGAGFLLMLFVSFPIGFMTTAGGLIIYWYARITEKEYDLKQEERISCIKRIESRVAERKSA